MVLAYGKTEAMEEVAVYRAAVGVEVETRVPDESKPASMLLPIVVKVMVPVAVRLARVRLPEKRAEPWTDKRDEGEVVPMPNLPVLVSIK